MNISLNPTAEEIKNLPQRFVDSVSSSYFKRFSISWIVWNWKLVYITIFDTELSQGETRIKFIVEHYSSCWRTLCFLVLFPAISTFLVFAFLEICNCISYGISMMSVKFRSIIQLKFEKSTVPTGTMISHFTEAMKVSQMEHGEMAMSLNNYKQETLDLQKRLIERTAEMVLSKRNLNGDIKMEKEELIRIVNELQEAANGTKVIEGFRNIYEKCRDKYWTPRSNEKQILDILINLKLITMDGDNYGRTQLSDDLYAFYSLESPGFL